jgi:peptide-N4-(N-acetyl-beta-glucosaminyl)asparagine amidase
MTEPFVNALLRKSGLRNKSRQPASSFGERIGLIDQASTYCWNLLGDQRIQFDQHLCPAIRRHLETYFESEQRGECLTVDIYLIGKSEKSAKATVLFISRCSETRKCAQKAVKQSGLLSDYPDFTTAVIAKDPGLAAVCASTGTSLSVMNSGPQTMELLALQQNGTCLESEPGNPIAETMLYNPSMELLASQQKGTCLEPGPGNPTAETVLYNPSMDLRIRGQAIYVQHESGVRMATANIVQLGHRFLLQTVYHVFLAPALHHDSDEALSEPNNGFEMDIESGEDEELSDEETLVEATSSGSRSSNSSAAGDSTSDDDCSALSIRPEQHMRGSESHHKISTDTHAHGENNSYPLMAGHTGHNATVPTPPLRTSLVPLGKLWRSSVENDWALIELTPAATSTYMSILVDNPAAIASISNNVSQCPTVTTDIVTWTPTGIMMRGTLSGSTWVMFPGSALFREVYQVQVVGNLLPGDCGSVVIDARSGDLYGYIVAGSPVSSVAYVMAAYQLAADFESVVEEDSVGRTYRTLAIKETFD